MNPPSDNRAVTALFRVFGGEDVLSPADARETARRRGMHRGEQAVFSVLIPLTALVAAGVLLSGWLGPVAGWLLAVPAAFLALNLLPFLLGVKNARLQWLIWLGLCVVWAVFHRRAGGIAGLLAWTWLAVAVMNLAASCVLDWRGAMELSGTPGLVWRNALLIVPHAAAVAIGFTAGWSWALACGAVIAAAFCWAVLRPGCQWLGPVYQTTDSDDVLITIDDGPDPQDTPVLLDLLDRHGKKAIFFVIGEKARAHPELVREIVRRGHEIGNHTLTHPAGSFWCAGPWRTRREIEGCQKIIADITGRPPRWFRAPAGHRNLFTHPIAKTLGLQVMGWNRRGYDAVEKDAGKVLGRILPNLSAGDIVLLHEATPIAEEVLRGVLEKSG